MDEKDVAVLLKYISNGIRVLSSRLMLVVTLLLTFSLFAWAMWMGDYMRLAIAVAFAVFVFLPVKGIDAKGAVQNAKGNEG